MRAAWRTQLSVSCCNPVQQQYRLPDSEGNVPVSRTHCLLAQQLNVIVWLGGIEVNMYQWRRAPAGAGYCASDVST